MGVFGSKIQDAVFADLYGILASHSSDFGTTFVIIAHVRPNCLQFIYRLSRDRLNYN